MNQQSSSKPDFELQEDAGPWVVDFWKPKHEGGRKTVVLQSDFFHYDAALEVSGDFGTFEEKVAYAQRLCDRLNGDEHNRNEKLTSLMVQAIQTPASVGVPKTNVLHRFSKLLVEDVISLLRQEWYDLNNIEKAEDESLRDVGIRVGKKSEIIALIGKIKDRFGVE